MTAIASPVELGSGRRSVYIDSANAPDVTDPNWIPILDSGALQKEEQQQTVFSEKEVSPFNQAGFSPFPTTSSTPEQGERPQSPTEKTKKSLKHAHSKSSFAPEAVPAELEAEPSLPARASSKSPFASPLPVENPLRGSSDGHDTSTSEGEGSTAPSTAGTASMIEEQYYTLPGMEVAKEDVLPPTAPISARSSIMSSRAKSPFVPTSKYNRKGIQSIASVNRPATIRSQPSSPAESPRMSSAVPVSNLSLPLSEAEEGQHDQSSHIPISTSASSTPVTSPRLISSKSTASDRKARALHSHPSSQNMHPTSPALPQTIAQPQPRGRSHSRSRANSNSNDHLDLDVLPKPPSVKHSNKPRSKSIESRPTTPRSIYDSQQPTPAPTTPLPQLPPEAFAPGGSNSKPSSRRPSVRTINNRPTAAESHIASASLVSIPRPSEHAEMADFMSRKSTVIFRRFDDVHVKLLLCLQDEISGLEEQLFALEQQEESSGGGGSGDVQQQHGGRPGQKMRVMRELRRVVAEYDHLFSNWSQMQANKADPQTMKDLREWLENPQAGPPSSSGGRDDLQWLNRQKDLSSVRLGAGEQKQPKQQDDIGSGRQSNEKMGSGGQDGGSARSKKGGGGGGLAGLFGCAGRRK